MLEPRESDVPVLLLVLVVLPIVIYILLGKWSEATKKKDRINLLAQLAAEESFRAETMAAASVIPLAPLPNNGVHLCARCYGPATTRCSRCKSVRYCSGRCQILHWRQIHNQECLQPENNHTSPSFRPGLVKEPTNEMPDLVGSTDSRSFDYNVEQTGNKIPLIDAINSPTGLVTSLAAGTGMQDLRASVRDGRHMNQQILYKSNREMSNSDDGVISASRGGGLCSTSSKIPSTMEVLKRHKSRKSTSSFSEEEDPGNVDSNCVASSKTTSKDTNEGHKPQIQTEGPCDSKTKSGVVSMLHSPKNVTCELEVKEDAETLGSNHSSERNLAKRSRKPKGSSPPKGTANNLLKSTGNNRKGNQLFRYIETDEIIYDIKVGKTRETLPAQEGNGVASVGIMKIFGLRKSSKVVRQETPVVSIDNKKKIKMLFPYEEFVEVFYCDVFYSIPRGLINCGNSCYANAVLQCLSCTKPLAIYLLRGSHSRTCCMKNWCLMCELEQHMMLRGHEGPLSPSRILKHMRNINRQIGDGSQEDAHEFLRFLVTSMQSICLEKFGGENVVDPRLQETTFIQHIFGGRLKSKVKCLRCHHESERYENIMDLTLEILDWVESLQDALAQFTSPEDLDGDNMYKCERCAGYVRAQKQLSIKEAPNILTVVLKRFQEGSYGKINKYISFPDMLDMIPFMTGTDDMPPLYMLYAVVVHLDTLNASFSGHYISYIKDLQGNWFRIDDSEVQPVSASQVMTEGAYILFYMRSSPRPAKGCTKKANCNQPRALKSSATERVVSNGSEQRMDDHISNRIYRNASRNRMEHYAEPVSTEFSDATSSDYSNFTSSDEASFTTESTRDSFSTVDAAAADDPASSMFSALYVPKKYSKEAAACGGYLRSGSKSQTRFVLEGKCFVMDSYLSTQPVDRIWGAESHCNT